MAWRCACCIIACSIGANLGLDEDLCIFVSQHMTLPEPEAQVSVMGPVGAPMRSPQTGQEGPGRLIS